MKNKQEITQTVSNEEIQTAIRQEAYHLFPGTTLTVCCLTLKNGFTTLGNSVCVDPNNFDKEEGKRIAREEAVLKIWPLLIYSMREDTYAAQFTAAATSEVKSHV